MKRESVGQILKRLDERVEERPFPKESSVFDTSRRYRIVAGESIDYADTLEAARVIAGEWQLEAERVVEIVRQQGRPRRWRAVLTDECDVRLRELFDDYGAPADAGSRRLANLAKYIDREERRRRRKMGDDRRREEKARHARATKFCKGCRRGLVCVNSTPPRAFESIADAARWASVNPATLSNAVRYRSGRSGGFHFKYADEILTAPKDYAAPVVEAAHEAIRLSGREAMLFTRETVCDRKSSASTSSESSKS